MASSSGLALPEQQEHGNPTSSGRYSVSFSHRGSQAASGWLAKKLLVFLVLLIAGVFSTLMALTVCLSLHRGAFCQREPDSSIILDSRPDSQWTQWSPCNVICGTGNRTRFRLPNSQTETLPTEVHPCTTPISCDAIYQWGAWSVWTPCSSSCRPGGRTNRSRMCRTVKQPTESRNCPGQDQESADCNVNVNCAVTYHWMQWSSWRSCTKTCGPGGVRNRTRECQTSSKLPANSKNCTGNDKDIQACNTGVQCPVTYHWMQWSSWSSCTKTCGPGGIRSRSRTCQTSNKSPASNTNCPGNDKDIQACNTGVYCPVLYHWSFWSNWTACSKSCHPGGIRHRRRNCLTVRNALTYAFRCLGNPADTRKCNLGRPCSPYRK